MEQLLQIRSVPINYEMKINHARLERQSGTADLEISRDEGGLYIKSRPVKIKIDTFEARNSITPSISTAISQAASNGTKIAYDVTARYASEGKLMLDTQIGEGAATIDQIIANRTARPVGDFQLGFIPSTGAEISATEGELRMEYEMDKLNFDWKIDKGQVYFVPGNIEVSITQMPDVEIEYVGRPIYVPPSAVENFTGQHVDVKA